MARWWLVAAGVADGIRVTCTDPRAEASPGLGGHRAGHRICVTCMEPRPTGDVADSVCVSRNETTAAATGEVASVHFAR